MTLTVADIARRRKGAKWNAHKRQRVPQMADVAATRQDHASVLVDYIQREKLALGTVLDPCCGIGVLSETLKNRGHVVGATDLNDWGYGKTGLDFFDENYPYTADTIVMHPPPSLAMEFIGRARALTGQVFAMVPYTTLAFNGEGFRQAYKLLLFPRWPTLSYHMVEKRQIYTVMPVWAWFKDGEEEPRVDWL